MSIGPSLSRLVLKRLVEDVSAAGGDVDAVRALLARGGREDGPRLSAIVEQALERGWRALEVALGDDRFWDHGQVGLAPGDALAFRQRLETVLGELAEGGAAPRPPGATAVQTALRQQCLWELRAAREAGALAGRLDADEWTRLDGLLPSGDRADGALLRALEQQGCVGLTRALEGSAGLPLLTAVTRAFVCQGLARWLRYCLQERPEQAPASAARMLGMLRELSSPRFSIAAPPAAEPEAPRPTPPAPSRPVPRGRSTHLRRPDHWRTPPERPGDRNKWTPRRIAWQAPAPRRPSNPASPAAARSPWLMRAVLALGVALLFVLPAWLWLAEVRERAAEQRRIAVESQRLLEERRRLDEEQQRLIDEQRRLAVAEAARQREAERRRLEEERRRLLEAEEERQRAEERAAREREAERRRREEERRVRLREEKERKERAKVVFERGLTHAAFRRDEQALAAFTEVLELDPDISQAWTERGLIRRRLGDNAGALEDFSQAIRRDAKDVRAWLPRGELHVLRRDYSLAIEDFTAVLRLQPRNARAYRERGLCHTHLYDYEKAIADETTAIELAPDDARAHFYRGNVHRLRNDLPRACADYDAALARDRGGDAALAPAYRARGMILLDREEYGRAIADLTRALEFNPTDIAAQQARSLAYLKHGDSNDALLDATEVIRRDPRNVDAFKVRGQAHLALEDYRKAQADFSQVISLHSTDPEAYYLRARARAQLGETREAIFDCNDALARNPDLAHALHLRGKLLLQEGERDRAVADQRRAHELNPLFPAP